MKNKPTLNRYDARRRESIVSNAANNIESFRHEATFACAQYTRSERRTIRSIQKFGISPYSFFTAWEDTLRPIRQSINDQATHRSLQNSLKRHLQLETDESSSLSLSIIKKRDFELVKIFISSLVIKKRSKAARATLREILSLPDSEIIELKDHYISWMLYCDIAEHYHINIIDKHSSVFKRLLRSNCVRRERKRIVQQERQRLIAIETRLHELTSMNNGIMHELLQKDIDLVAITSIRTQYEKELKQLRKTEEVSAADKLALFNEVTKNLCSSYTKKVAKNRNKNSLASAYAIGEDIQYLLLRVFELSNKQKNTLMVHMKEHRELEKEKASIIQAQTIRILAQQNKVVVSLKHDTASLSETV